MHSSRMRTVCNSSRLPGGCLLQGGACLLPGRVGCLVQGGMSAPGGVVSQHALRQIPPVNRMTDRQV